MVTHKLRRTIFEDVMESSVAFALDVRCSLSGGDFDAWVRAAESRDLFFVLETTGVVDDGEPREGGDFADARHGHEVGEERFTIDSSLADGPLAGLHKLERVRMITRELFAIHIVQCIAVYEYTSSSLRDAIRADFWAA